VNKLIECNNQCKDVKEEYRKDKLKYDMDAQKTEQLKNAKKIDEEKLARAKTEEIFSKEQHEITKEK
jgi:hypothetical protein